MHLPLKFRIVAAVALFTTVLGVYSAKSWPASETGTNFEMYYTAACLVRSGASAQIYEVIPPDQNPQQLFANPRSLFAQTARAHGISRISLYVYPPTLADLIVPLALLPASSALLLWNGLELVMIFALGLMLARMLGIDFRGAAVAAAAFILLFRPTLNTFHWGQVTILLAFLLVLGLWLYSRAHRTAAAVLFALAIAIKLEPVVIVVPLIAWRDWKTLRSLALCGVLLFLGLWSINGGSALSLYFLHQLPAMSSGISADVNRSLGNLFYTWLGGAHPVLSPRGLSWLVRALSALILCYAGWLSRITPGLPSVSRRQFEIGMVFLLFACCLSPYSWFYNWALTAPVVIMLFRRAWDGRADTIETALLAAFLLSLTTSKFQMAMITPVVGVVLGIVVLRRMRLEQNLAETTAPAALAGATAS